MDILSLYCLEGLLKNPLERIGHLETENNNNNKRFSILAEITRLCQACCHASLVNEEMVIESSKVKTFLQLVKNMIDNKHKVLVFSQFVRYLAKIKEVLDQENIFYQSLDGTTPIKERQRFRDREKSRKSKSKAGWEIAPGDCNTLP